MESAASSFGHRPRSTLAPRLAIAVVLGIALGLLAWGPGGRALEQRGLDLLFLLRGALPAPEDLVIVAIDEPSFKELGLQWPWPRSLHARLIERLRGAGARVIALDILFAEPSSPAEDAALSKAVARAGNVVLASDVQVVEIPLASHATVAQHMIPVPPLPELARAAAAVGVVALAPDRDAVIRTAALREGGQPTFAYAVAQVAGWRGSAGGNPLLINHLGPSPAIRTVSYVQALAPAPDGLPDATFANKLVFVGRAVGPNPEADRAVVDSHLTPYFWSGRRLVPGVEIHATIVDTLLRGRAIDTVSVPAGVAWTLALTLATAVLVGWLGPWTGLAAAFGLVAVEGSVALVAFAGRGFWVPWLTPALAVLGTYGGGMVARWRQRERERALVRRAFQHYVHPAVVAEILADPGKLRLGGELVEATVLYSDLQGYTQVSERLSPPELIALLNEYFSAMTEHILDERGMLNRTIGDAILALWGVPVPDAAHPLGACRAALAMQRRLAALNRSWAVRGHPALRMRIGVHTGKMVVGNVGSAERFDYTAMGDAVNLAARLEGINKLYGTCVVVSEDTARHVAAAMALRELDRIRVVGREQPVRIYECVAEQDALDAVQSALLDAFGLGLTAYEARDWARALRHFEQALAIDPNDGPSRLYVERVRAFQVTPPPADWDGVATMASKQG